LSWDLEIYYTLVAKIVQDLTDKKTKLFNAFENDNIKEIKAICHNLKGSALNAWFGCLGQLIQGFETRFDTLSKDERIKELNNIILESEKVIEILSEDLEYNNNG